jgi:hypothetical protein
MIKAVVYYFLLYRDLLSSSIVHRAMHEYLRNANETGRAVNTLVIN